MEDLVLKKKKENVLDKINNLFKNKKKRYLYMVLFMLPFLITIGIFSFIAFKEAKNLINLANGETVVNEKHIIRSVNYVLRDNATDLQEQYFAELKDAIENGTADDKTIAELVAKNYVADFYTLTNKQGIYDIGGMYYVYDNEFEDGNHIKPNMALIAKDGFYKYLNKYIKDYGADNLIEVSDVQIIESKQSTDYEINEYVGTKYDEENDVWYKDREDHVYDAYEVSCKWSYKEGSLLNTNDFATSINLLIINKNGRFEIVEASESKIEKENVKNEIIQEEEKDTSSENSYR